MRFTALTPFIAVISIAVSVVVNPTIYAQNLTLSLPKLHLTNSAPQTAPFSLVKFDTTEGEIVVQLYPNRTPDTVNTFLTNTAAGDYTNSIIHQSVQVAIGDTTQGAVIVGGGFTFTDFAVAEPDSSDYVAINANAPTVDERGVVSNLEGTLAMLNVAADDATISYWFFNLLTNGNFDELDGYVPFGRIVDGLDVAKAIGLFSRCNCPVINPAFTSLPLSDVTSVQQGIFPDENALAMINTIEPITNLTYTIDTDRADLMTVSIVNGEPTITPQPGAMGSGHVTITATGPGGRTYTTTVVASVEDLRLNGAFQFDVANDFPVVRFGFRAPFGDVLVRLFARETPTTTTNFLSYVDSGAYTNSFIHRSVPGFVIQGGGFTFTDIDDPTPEITDYHSILKGAAIQNEFEAPNLRGTISMAKIGGNPDSATSEWFFNLADNRAILDDQNGGFTVFAEVIGNGMTTIDTIAGLPITTHTSLSSGVFAELPVSEDSAVFLPDETDLVMLDIIERVTPEFEVSTDRPDLITVTTDETMVTIAPKAGVVGDANVTLTMTVAGEEFEETFAVKVISEFRGQIWHDSNQDGINTENEDGVGHATITLYTDNGNAVFDGADTVATELSTSADGTYSLTVAPGTYWAALVPPTSPHAGRQLASGAVVREVIIPSGTIVEGIDYGVLVAGAEVPAGWSLFSLPCDPLVADPAQFGLRAIWEWDAASGRQVRANTLQALRGYWALSQQPRTITMLAAPCANTGIDLTTGWHVVGPTADIDLPDNADLESAFWAWNGHRFFRASNLRAGRAYWVKVGEPTTLELGAPGQ